MPIVIEGEPVPTGEDVARFLGQGDNTELVAQAQDHVNTITALARAYTRDRGFDDNGDPAPDVSAVIITATARLVANPEQVAYMIGTTQFQGGFQGWNLAEIAVLNRYRKRAM